LGASTSWNPQGLSRSLMGLLYLYFMSKTGIVRNKKKSSAAVRVRYIANIFWKFSEVNCDTYLDECRRIIAKIIYKIMIQIPQGNHYKYVAFDR
jgi:hypothetical protein